MPRKRFMNFAFASLLVLLFPLQFLVPRAICQTQQTNPAPTFPQKVSPAPSFSGFHEDYKSLTLESSTLAPQKPALLDKTDILDGTYVRERIKVGWRPNDSFDLYVAHPKSAKKSPVVLYLYSFPESATRFQSEEWYRGVAKEGYAVVGFVSAITAERAENRHLDEWFVRLLPEALASSVHDVSLILNYLDSRGDMDMDRVGMFATGSGASIALLSSAADPRIKALDVFNPWGDWPTWAANSWVIPEEKRVKTENKFLDPQFLELVAPLDPVRWVSQVQAHSLRIQSVRSEATAPAETVKKITENAPDRAEINEFADYRVWMSVERGPEIFGWLRNALRPEAKATVVATGPKHIHFFNDEPKSSTAGSAHP